MNNDDFPYLSELIEEDYSPDPLILYHQSPRIKIYLNKNEFLKLIGLNMKNKLEVISLEEDRDYENNLILTLEIYEGVDVFETNRIS